jgi:predicted nucleic acid-binding protein
LKPFGIQFQQDEAKRSRDANDDPYLACALAAGAKAIITRDHDLLVLQKPFGIEMITPRELLTRLAKPL